MVIKESSSVHWGPVWQKREDSENGQTARAVGIMMSRDRCGTTNLETLGQRRNSHAVGAEGCRHHQATDPSIVSLFGVDRDADLIFSGSLVGLLVSFFLLSHNCLGRGL